MKWPEIDWRRSMYRWRQRLERKELYCFLVFVECLLLFLLIHETIPFNRQVFVCLATLTALLFVLFVASDMYRESTNNKIRTVALVAAILIAAVTIILLYMFLTTITGTQSF